MNKPAAFRATYSDLKLIKTRQCVQVIFELPLADFDAAYTILGGMPNPARETWFGIAPLKLPPAEKESSKALATPQLVALDKSQPVGAKRDWRDIPPPQQAGIRCDDPIFAAFLKEQRADDWYESPDPVDCVYLICGIISRSELATNQKSRVLWHSLDLQFQAWKALEHA